MANIKQLVENKTRLDYPALCKALIEQFGVGEAVNWDSVLPAPQQQELFGGEVLRFVETHPQLASQKDIRPIALKKGSTSQMLFFFVCLADKSLPKKQIEQITKRFIKGTDANRYIIWFFGNKEAAELKVVLSAREGKKIVLKSLPFGIEQPYYKTYDYILTEVTAKVQQLFVEPTDLWKALWKAFDISIVNRRFYDEIKQAFDSILLQINKKGNPFKTDEDRAQFAIRLLGRIIFCWFLKRKNILKEEALSSKAVLNYKDKNYYHELLEPLFFEVMNKPEKERIGGLPKIIAHYSFLNGGLFDANKETDFYDADTSTPDFRLNIENDWFYNFFSITLEKYNFTVDENSSSNAEIAIDPEMLGRIFENLLAEQNPETGESARKATGSFYTPREIVDYMVEQSIAEYLKTALGDTNDKPSIEKDLFGNIINPQLEIRTAKISAVGGALGEALEDFVHTSHLPGELRPQAQSLLDALNKIKVLDPACGSGAFPIGVLQKLLALKQEIVQVQNPKKQISQSAAYKLKLGTIQNSIYGVDIQPMAVELSRLRCWLSLVVDEENDNIKALPNLDFKFICADSLVDLPDNEYVKIQSQKSLTEFTSATEQYFNPDYKQKTELKATIKRCLNEITNIHDVAINQIITQLRKERNSASASRLKQLEKSLLDYTKQQSIWHSYRNIFENRKVNFFNLQYFFPFAKNGFDIVIGNPPYVQIQKLSVEVKTELESQRYLTFSKSGDIYQLFYERGNRLLKQNGHLCFITSNKWMRTDYGNVTRQYFAANTKTLIVVDFGMAQVFESATTYTNIILFQKASPISNITLCRVENDYQSDTPLSEYINSYAIEVEHPGAKSWIAYRKEQYPLIKRIEKQGVSLKDWKIQINYGIKTGFNDAFIIDTEIRDQLVAEDPKSSEILKPILRGEDVKPYLPDWAGKWLINTHNGIKSNGTPRVDVVKNYKAVYKWLSKSKNTLEKRQDKGDHWTNLRNCAYIEEFAKPKIIYPNMTKFMPFVYDKGSFFINDKAFIITGEHLGYLTAFFNSRLFRFCFKEYFPELLGETRELRKVFFETIPVKVEIDESWFEATVNKIQENKVKKRPTKDLEIAIDDKLYDYYQVSEKEREMIHVNTEMH